MANFDHLMGWRDEPEHVNAAMADLPYPLFKDAYSNIKGTAKGKQLLLPDIVRKVMGYYPIGHQLTGDCVSFGSAYAATVLSCVQVYLGKMETFEGLVASEPIYAGSRIQVGGGALGNGQGSVGLWACKWLNNYSVILRKNYDDIGIDLTNYDVNKATNWGTVGHGCPELLIPKGHDHLVKSISQVSSFDECCDAIYNGYPVTVASNVGFAGMTRDNDGFMRHQDSWGHEMYFAGFIYGRRPGLLCVNSWGDWATGPTPYDIPKESFFIDADTVDLMVSAGDSWVLSNYDGYKIQDLDWNIV